MGNLVRKFITKLISKIRLKNRWNELFNNNHSSGYLIEAIQIKLILMLEEWPKYKYSEIQETQLIELIELSDGILKKLEAEDKLSHIRSDEYKKLQNSFFTKLNLYAPDLFY